MGIGPEFAENVPLSKAANAPQRASRFNIVGQGQEQGFKCLC